MKLWLKYLIGTALGVAIPMVLQKLDALSSTTSFLHRLLAGSSHTIESVVDTVCTVVIHIGRCSLVPLLLFSIGIAVYNLRTTRSFWRTLFLTIILGLLSSIIMALLAIVAVHIYELPWIPVTTQSSATVPTIKPVELLLALFPTSGFAALIDGDFLLPTIIFASLCGYGLAENTLRSSTSNDAVLKDSRLVRLTSMDLKQGYAPSQRSAVSLFDQLSRVCYATCHYLIQLMSVGIIALAARLTWQLLKALNTQSIRALLMLLALSFVFLALVLVPICLRILASVAHPYKVLYACLAPLLLALFGGDTNLCLTLALRTLKENLSVHRRVNSLSLSLLSVFSRGGSLYVILISFIAIVSSYSRLGISFIDILWIALIAFALSLVLGGLPEGGAFVAITLMCSIYGRGIDTGYLLLIECAPVLCAIATAMDTLINMVLTYVIALKSGSIEKVDIKDFS